MESGASRDGVFYERLAFWVSCSVAFIVYVFSLGNGVDFGAMNQRVVAASTWGVAAPPGYPIWTMIANLFTTLFGWVTWEGMPNPAWAVSLFSALCGALSVGLLAQLMTCMLIDVLGGTKQVFWNNTLDENKCSTEPEATSLSCLSAYTCNRKHRWITFVLDFFLRRNATSNASSSCQITFWIAPLVCFLSSCAALLFAISPQQWSCAVRPDVETWEMLLFCALLLWSYRFLKHPTAKVFGILLFLFGIALTNGLPFVWFGVPLLGIVFLSNRSLALAFLSLLIPIGLTIHLLSIGALPSAYEGRLLWDSVVLVRPVAQAMHGVLPLCFLPWGYYVGFAGLLLIGCVSLVVWPRSSQASLLVRRIVSHWWLGVAIASLGFLGLLSFAIVHSAYVISPLFKGHFYSFDHVWIIHLMALAVLWVICFRFHRSRRYALAVSFVQIALLLLYQYGFMIGVTHPRLWWFWWPLIWVGIIFALGWRWLLNGRGAVRSMLLLFVGFISYLYVPLVGLLSDSPEQWGEPFSWLGFHRVINMGVEIGLPTKETFVALGEMCWNLCFSEGLGILFWGGLGFVVMGYYGSGRYRVRWIGFLLAWLVCCCLVFLLLPEGEVLYIHHLKLRLGVIFTIGLSGLITIAVCLILRSLRGPWLTWGGVFVAIGMLVFMIGVFVYTTWIRPSLSLTGGSEMRGHTTAWAWGASLLEGAPRLRQGITEEDEPLPDPFWPPPVEMGSVVLSSTEIPYYFTEVVGLRSDVAVFGMHGWADEFTSMVRRRRKINASFEVPNTSAIETQMYQLQMMPEDGAFFENLETPQEKLEALVLSACLKDSIATPIYFEAPLPYNDLYYQLEPAGFVLRKVSSPQTRTIGIRDVDFWDWYSRHLSRQPNFMREVHARRHFAQHQLTLAELYRRQGELHLAYGSLMTAMSIYPVDATVPYVEIVLLRSLAIEGTKLPIVKVENALKMLYLAAEKDPKNKTLPQLIEGIEKQKNALECCKRLQLSLNKGTISINEGCLYLDACLQLGAHAEAREVARGIVSRFIPTATFMDVFRRVMCLESPELHYSLIAKMPPELYEQLTEKELLESAKIAVDCHHRPLAKTLLVKGEERFKSSALLYWRMAYYHYYCDDLQLAVQYVDKAKGCSPRFVEQLPEEEQALCREIEDRYQRLKEKGTRL